MDKATNEAPAEQGQVFQQPKREGGRGRGQRGGRGRGETPPHSNHNPATQNQFSQPTR